MLVTLDLFLEEYGWLRWAFPAAIVSHTLHARGPYSNEDIAIIYITDDQTKQAKIVFEDTGI